MKIEVTHNVIGNPLHGDHDVDTIVTFDYADGSAGWLRPEREMEIIRAIVPESIGWWSLKEQVGFTTGHVRIGARYVINHGYDSGD